MCDERLTLFTLRRLKRSAATVLCVLLSLPLAHANELTGNTGGDPPSSPITSGVDSASSCGASSNDCEAHVDVGSAPAGNEPASNAGNPINLMSGNKYQREVDFQIPGAMLSLSRMYNSANSDSNRALGQGWHHSYSVSLFNAGQNRREIVQSNGARLMFDAQGANEDGDPLFRAVHSHQGYLVYRNKRHYWHIADGRILTFNGSYLTQIDWPDQRNLTLYYRSKRLHSVTDETGRRLVFNYTGDSRAEVLPAFDPIRFGPASGYLESVTLSAYASWSTTKPDG